MAVCWCSRASRRCITWTSSPACTLTCAAPGFADLRTLFFPQTDLSVGLVERNHGAQRTRTIGRLSPQRRRSDRDFETRYYNADIHIAGDWRSPSSSATVSESKA
jgi:hypothetical protein